MRKELFCFKVSCIFYDNIDVDSSLWCFMNVILSCKVVSYFFVEVDFFLLDIVDLIFKCIL